MRHCQRTSYSLVANHFADSRTSSHSARGFGWKWRNQNEPKWTKVNQSEPKKLPQRFAEAEKQAVEESYINPLHPSSLPISSKICHPNPPPPALPLLSHPPCMLSKYDLLIILYNTPNSASKITRQSSQYLPRPTRTRAVRGRSFFLKDSDFHRLRRFLILLSTYSCLTSI